MSLTIVAIAGILLGFLCLMVGFFMQGTAAPKEKKGRTVKRRLTRKAA